MTAAWLQTAGDIVNAVAVDVGLDEASDPFASSDRAFVRLCSLLNGAGQELCLSRDWAALTRQGTFTHLLYCLPVCYNVYPSVVAFIN